MADENLLLVEGVNDQNVLWHLMNNHNIARGIIEVKPFGGVESLLTDLPLQLRSAAKRLGIVVDADTDLSSRWESLRNILIAYNYKDVPASPMPEGTIVEPEDLPIVRVPKVGLWIMPDNQMPGMLEHFVSFLGATTDPLWPVADDCLNHIPQDHIRFNSNQRIKAHLHTWLAWQAEPGQPIGLAITKTFLDANAPHARQLIGWIRRLFDL
jgi:hypothetical protein